MRDEGLLKERISFKLHTEVFQEIVILWILQFLNQVKQDQLLSVPFISV